MGDADLSSRISHIFLSSPIKWLHNLPFHTWDESCTYLEVLCFLGRNSVFRQVKLIVSSSETQCFTL